MADQSGPRPEASSKADITPEECARMLFERVKRTEELVNRIKTLISEGADYNRVKEMHELVHRLIDGVPSEALEGISIAGMESAILILKKGKH